MGDFILTVRAIAVLVSAMSASEIADWFAQRKKRREREIADDRKNPPNQSLEPTTLLGTSAAEQPLVPSRVVAHL